MLDNILTGKGVVRTGRACAGVGRGYDIMDHMDNITNIKITEIKYL